MLRLGTLRGLQQCATANGIFTVLALDHRQSLRKALRPDDPGSVGYGELVEFKQTIVRELAPAASAIVLDPELGAAQCIASGSLPGNRGLIVAVEATGFSGDPGARQSRVLDGWSVGKAKRLGASAVKLLVHYRPDARNAGSQERLVEEVARECRAHELALFLEPVVYAGDDAPLTGDNLREAVVEAARRLTRLGGDVLKAQFPCEGAADSAESREACEELSAASSLPWVLLSGGAAAEVFRAQLEVACRAGASGMVAGRSLWSEATRLDPERRQRFLAEEARSRIEGLAAVCEAHARPWTAAQPDTPWPEEGWFRAYPGLGD